MENLYRDFHFSGKMDYSVWFGGKPYLYKVARSISKAANSLIINAKKVAQQGMFFAFIDFMLFKQEIIEEILKQHIAISMYFLYVDYYYLRFT